MSDLAFQSTATLVEMIGERKISAVELTSHYLERIEHHNRAVNAIVHLDAEAALNAAKSADAALSQGRNLGPLHGLPMTIKDAYEVAGQISTGGAQNYADHRPVNDADIVARLRAAGAVMLGKTNVPYMSGDWQSYNEIYGRTNNPHNLDHTPGGSSGGPAAAIAAGLTGADIGSDIGGSIRVPAHFCGIYGLKPSYGLISMRGHIPPPPGYFARTDLAVAGPLGRSVDDLELLFGLMVGAPPYEKSTHYKPPEPRHSEPSSLRVAVWADDPFSPVGKETTDTVLQAGRALTDAGATVDYDARPDIDFARSAALYETLLGAIMASDYPIQVQQKLIVEAQRLDENDIGHRACQARGASLTYGKSLGLLAFREQLKQAWISFFEDYDAILTPVSHSPAFLHDTESPVSTRAIDIEGIGRDYLDILHWIGLATVCHLPAVSVPFGQSSSGLPIGVQVIGPLQEDRTALFVARALETAVGPVRIPDNLS